MQVDNAEDLAVAKLMYNLIKYSEKCSKAPEGLYQFCRAEPKDTTADFESFKFNILNSINHTRKSDKIHKDFELYQAFMHNFLSQNVSIFPIYILLTRRINTFRSKGTDKVWGSIETFWAQEIIHKIQKFSYIIFCPKMSQYLQIIY